MGMRLNLEVTQYIEKKGEEFTFNIWNLKLILKEQLLVNITWNVKFLVVFSTLNAKLGEREP